MKIKHIKKVKPRTVYAIETSTDTLISDGLAHHNCPGCNLFKHGNKIKYVAFMIKKGYTIEQLDSFDNLKFKTKKYTDQDYLEIYKKYEEKINELDA